MPLEVIRKAHAQAGIAARWQAMRRKRTKHAAQILQEGAGGDTNADHGVRGSAPRVGRPRAVDHQRLDTLVERPKAETPDVEAVKLTLGKSGCRVDECFLLPHLSRMLPPAGRPHRGTNAERLRERRFGAVLKSVQQQAIVEAHAVLGELRTAVQRAGRDVSLELGEHVSASVWVEMCQV